MPLQPGARLGPYEVDSVLGSARTESPLRTRSADAGQLEPPSHLFRIRHRCTGRNQLSSGNLELSRRSVHGPIRTLRPDFPVEFAPRPDAAIRPVRRDSRPSLVGLL